VIKIFQSQANDTKQGIAFFTPVDSAFAAVDGGVLSNLATNQLSSLMLHEALPTLDLLWLLRVETSPVPNYQCLHTP
jgi:hypothetical protein